MHRTPLSVLMVGGDPSLAHTFESTLQAAPLARFSVIHAPGLDVAHEKIAGSAPDAVILNLTESELEPALSGLCEAAPCPVVAVVETEQAGSRARRQGAWDFVIAADIELGRLALTLLSAVEPRVLGERSEIATEVERNLLAAQRAEQVTTVARRVLHDVNNLLAVIQGAHSLLRTEHPEQPALNYIAEAVERSGEAVERLLMLMRGRGGAPSVTETTQVLGDVAVLVCSLLPKEMRPVLEIDDQLPPVPLSATELETILIALVNRACDSMPMGGELRISATSAGGSESRDQRRSASHPSMRLVVTDQGESLHPEPTRRLSEPAESGERTRKSRLGLSVVKRIVAIVGGSLSVTGNPEEGTRVTVELPPASAEPPDVAIEVSTEQ